MERSILSEAQLHCFPSTDEDFAEYAHASASTLSSGQATVTPETLAEKLRERYAQAEVHEQSSFGALSPHERVWYVYRERTR